MRLTGRGIGLLAAGLALLVTGFTSGYPELAALGCASVVAVLVAATFVAWRPRLVVARAVDPDRVMRGEPSQVGLHISNASRLFGASLVARDRCWPAVTVPVPLLRLRPGRVMTVSYPVPTHRRGVFEVGPLEITRRDPLGLAGVVRRFGDPALVRVRPRAHPMVRVPVGLSRSLDGRVDRLPYGSITFAALREYVVGDDLRNIHWRTSARVGELMVREHVDTSLPRVVVLLDDRAWAHRPDGRGESTFEAACEAAASVVLAAVREGVPVAVHLTSGPAAAADQTGPGPPLDLLAEATLVGGSWAQRPDPLWEAVQRLRVRRHGDTLLYLAGPVDQDDLGLVAGLGGGYASVIAGVFGPAEDGAAGGRPAEGGPAEGGLAGGGLAGGGPAGGGPVTTGGLRVLRATDGADFAAVWNGVPAW